MSENLTCTHADTVAIISTAGYWIPNVTCDPLQILVAELRTDGKWQASRG